MTYSSGSDVHAAGMWLVVEVGYQDRRGIVSSIEICVLVIVSWDVIGLLLKRLPSFTKGFINATLGHFSPFC